MPLVVVLFFFLLLLLLFLLLLLAVIFVMFVTHASRYPQVVEEFAHLFAILSAVEPVVHHTSGYALQGRRFKLFRYSSRACMLHPTGPAPPLWPPRRHVASDVPVLFFCLLIIKYKCTIFRESVLL